MNMKLEYDQLVKLVKEYIKEIQNPSPDVVLRVDMRRRLAEAVGMEDPVKVLARWRRSGEKL